MISRLAFVPGVAAVLIANASPAAVQPYPAQTYPTRAIRIIVPTAPGGAIDATARVVGEKLQQKWGKPVLVENRPGAGMRIGAEAAAKSQPDGYTLLVAHDGTMAINPVAYPDLPYDPQKDFEPVGLVASIPEAMMVSVGVPVKSVAELIALAKQRPDALTHATGGSATLLALELFKAMAGVKIRSIPYRGGAPAVTATIGGETSMIIADLTTGSAALQSDRIRPLAVTSVTRSKKYPGLPTLDEQGVVGYEVNTWMGFFAPAATPKSILGQLEGAITEALVMPDVRARFEIAGMDVRSGSAVELRSLLAGDIAKWSKLVRENNIQIVQ
jgi:tripartite-type tricarboxylate transporter receptor subunit TctC